MAPLFGGVSSLADCNPGTAKRNPDHDCLPGAMKSAYSQRITGFSNEPAERPDQKLSSSHIATFAKEAIHATHVSCFPCDRACSSQRSGCGPGPATDVRHHEGHR